MKSFIGNVLATLVSVVLCLGIAELAMRWVDGLPLFASWLPPVGGTWGSDTTATHFPKYPRPEGTSWELFKTNPPPLANRKEPSEEWKKLNKQVAETAAAGSPFKPWDMFKYWNSVFVGDPCSHPLIKHAPGELYLYDPPDGHPRPMFRFFESTTTPRGLTTNAFGWRGREVPFQKGERTIRIVFLGASTMSETHDFPFSSPELVDNWFNEWARKRNLDVRFEVMNAARESVNSTDLAQIVKHEVAPLRPDIVVYYEGLNQFDMKSVVKDPPTGTPAPPDWIGRTMYLLSEHSALARRLENFLTSKEWKKPSYDLVWPAGVDEKDPDLSRADLPVNMPLILKNLDSIRADLKPVGSELVLASFQWMPKDGLELNAGRHKAILENINVSYFPYTYRDLERLTNFENRVYRKYASQHDLGFIDVAGQMPRDPELFSDAMHNTPEGVRLRAWIYFLGLLPIVEQRLASGALPKPVTPMGEKPAFFTQPGRHITFDCSKKTGS